MIKLGDYVASTGRKGTGAKQMVTQSR